MPVGMLKEAEAVIIKEVVTTKDISLVIIISEIVNAMNVTEYLLKNQIWVTAMSVYMFTYMCVCVCVCVLARARMLSHIWLFVTPWTVAHQAPLSMGFPRQEYWSGLPFSSPGTLPDPGIEPTSLVSPALAGRFFTINPTAKPIFYIYRERRRERGRMLVLWLSLNLKRRSYPSLKDLSYVHKKSGKVKKWKSLSHVHLFLTSWTVARQASLSMEFSRQEDWSGCHFLFQMCI